MMSIENYKKKLELMSKEELLHEISNLISDHGIQLQAKNTELQELKSALTRADLQLQFQIGEVDLNNREIELLTEELEKTRDNRNGWRNRAWEDERQNSELQKQADELKEERENVQKILDELGKCENDKERYAAWVKLIKRCGVEVE